MSRFTLDSGNASSVPGAGREDSTAEVTSHSSKTNDAPKNESSSPELDNPPKEDQQPLTLGPRKLSYAAKKRAKKAAKNAAKQQE